MYKEPNRAFRILFDKFWGRLTKTNIDLPAVLVKVHLIVKRPLLLLVDELMKCGEDGATKILHAIGICLNEHPPEIFDCIVSTLDTSPVFKENSSSGRPLLWVNLPPLSQESSEKIFGTLPMTPELKLCIAECNGHPRALECIWSALKKFSGQRHIKTEYIIKAAIDDWGTRLPPISDAHLKIALNGKPVYPEDTIEELNIATELLKGTFLNANVKKQTKFIPQLSPFSLRVIAARRGHSQFDFVSQFITSMLSLEEGFDWNAYEKFHANWEMLKRVLFSGSTRTFAEFYNCPTKLQLNPSFVLQKKDLKFLNQHFNEYCEKEKPQVDTLLDHGFLPAANNPGFDFISFEKNVNSNELIAIAVECKYSYPGSKNTTLNKTKVEEKWVNTLSQLETLSSILICLIFILLDKKIEGKTLLKQSNIFLVVVSFQKVTKELLPGDSCVLNSNILVLDKEALEYTYSPTLFSRPQFISSSNARSTLGMNNSTPFIKFGS